MDLDRNKHAHTDTQSSEILFTPIFYMDKVSSQNQKMINFGCAYCGWNGLIVCSYIYTFLSSRTLSLVNTCSLSIYKHGGDFFSFFFASTNQKLALASREHFRGTFKQGYDAILKKSVFINIYCRLVGL